MLWDTPRANRLIRGMLKQLTGLCLLLMKRQSMVSKSANSKREILVYKIGCTNLIRYAPYGSMLVSKQSILHADI